MYSAAFPGMALVSTTKAFKTRRNLRHGLGHSCPAVHWPMRAATPRFALALAG